ncbi:hypothetical protein [Varunaivibrio sulfuroxidans]|uniref:Tetratricopeptide repeat protein n=1 Tax=Varunaivibrio sulfuroxidans TaxID=1773489 RepID=A0A4R3J8E9_9PROT|nr:hypothetical protein [Varunaivibrio sulfuroxidans]TCS61767.1 hypothetical protein EDD55_107176 [Varunaivibrio sulfuroxidans]WES32049.1 hypothetical protein P3M64_06750 [Varunaivibrio sulfuroxidans]
MDLLDFETRTLYCDEALPARAKALIDQASAATVFGVGQGASFKIAEAHLQEAQKIAPDHLSVLVALYRFYFYTHRLEDSLDVAHRAIGLLAERLGLPASWNEVSPEMLEEASAGAMPLVRFYLQSLKAVGYLHLRLGAPERAQAALDKVQACDSNDRLGARVLSVWARGAIDGAAGAVDSIN